MSLEKDIAFLEKLDKKVHSVFVNNDRNSVYSGTQTDTYPDKKLSEAELERVLAICKEYELPMEPCNTDFGFRVGFGVYRTESVPGVNEVERVLIFSDRQVPKGGLKKVWNYIQSERNVELLKVFEFEPLQDPSSYEY